MAFRTGNAVFQCSREVGIQKAPLPSDTLTKTNYVNFGKCFAPVTERGWRARIAGGSGVTNA